MEVNLYKRSAMFVVVFSSVFLFLSSASGEQGGTSRENSYWIAEESPFNLEKISQDCPGWPAKFFNDSLLSHPGLPDLLTLNNGTKITSPEVWSKYRRPEIKKHLETYMSGTPPNRTARVIDQKVFDESFDQYDGIAQFYNVNLTIHDDLTHRNVSFVIQVLLPVGHKLGQSTAKLFLTQRTHFPWARATTTRGYVSCVYPGGDSDDQSGPLTKMYPEATWSLLLRRAWLGMRALDYCLTLVGPADKQDVIVTGHSRNGKQSLLFGAYDSRVTMVIPSSSGIGGWSTLRESSLQSFGEGPGDAPVSWFIPSYRCFLGFEDRLPMDWHGLVGLIAPRPVVSLSALNDGCVSVHAVEATYRAVLPVYELLNAKGNIRIHYRPGQHHGYLVAQEAIDFMDVFTQQGTCSSTQCRHIPQEYTLPQALYRTFKWRKWRELVGKLPQLSPPGLGIGSSIERRRILGESPSRWFLGEVPVPQVRVSTFMAHGEESQGMPVNAQSYITSMITRNLHGVAGVDRTDVTFGEYHTASIYFPKNFSPSARLPVALWLHPFNYNMGFNEGYMKASDQIAVYYRIASQGYVVVAWDMAGFGMRQAEVYGQRPSFPTNGSYKLPPFYWRHPRWSLLGKHVEDARIVVDALTNPYNKNDRYFPLGHGGYPATQFPKVDPNNIYAVGFSQLGGTVALFLAATDSRLRGAVSIAGLTSFRTPIPEIRNRHLFETHALLPILGYFDKREKDIPFDMDDVLAEASCPVFVYAPRYDRFNPIEHVKHIVERAKEKGAKIDLEIAKDAVGALDKNAAEEAIRWLNSQVSS